MSISSQTIRQNYETKSTLTNTIETQSNSIKSKKQSIEQEEDTTSNVSSITTPSFTKKETRVNKVDEFKKNTKIINNIQYQTQ